MKISEIVAPLEEFAPLELQEDYDNSGLLVGRADDEVKSALVCVDVTKEVMDEAVALGVQLVISHHPVVFNPLKRLNSASNVEKVVERAIRERIALYACHTNLDSAPNGMSFSLARTLGVEVEATLAQGFGVIGTLPQPVDTLDFLREVQQRLRIKAVRHSDIVHEKIHRVALCGGSAAVLIPVAEHAGAELFMAADFKYKDFLAAAGVLTIADIGHFESEFCAIDLIYDIISKKIPNFVLHKSVRGHNPVSYLY